MPKPPFINFPFPFYKTPYARTPNFQKGMENSNTPSPNTSSFVKALPEINSNNINSQNCNKKNKSNSNSKNCLFDLFGLKIYSDDVLLVSIIYFLYSEEVKDDGLFIVLILLLLS